MTVTTKVPPGGLPVGSLVEVRGVPNYSCTNFSVNFQVGERVGYQRDDTPFRFCVDFVREVVYCNSILGNELGREEGTSRNPLHLGDLFAITVKVESGFFNVQLVNRGYQYSMPFRYHALDRITCVIVEGDVVVHQVQISPPLGYSAPLYGAPHNAPYPGASYYPGAPAQYSTSYPQQPPVNPSYPQQPMGSSPYPQQPGYAAPYPQQQPGYYNPGAPGYGQPSHSPSRHDGSLGAKIGAALGTGAIGAALASGHLNPKKALKDRKKMAKKALKYGVPIAGVGVGAYALHKGVKKFGWSSSSSSSSSSDEE